MRSIHSHEVTDADKSVEIKVLDHTGAGGAHHEYCVSWSGSDKGLDFHSHSYISFQNGPIAEHGINGLTQEALLAIVIDRLECFQAGPFASEYNAVALVHARAALSSLQKRTKDRIARGVEGRSAA